MRARVHLWHRKEAKNIIHFFCVNREQNKPPILIFVFMSFDSIEIIVMYRNRMGIMIGTCMQTHTQTHRQREREGDREIYVCVYVRDIYLIFQSFAPRISCCLWSSSWLF